MSIRYKISHCSFPSLPFITHSKFCLTKTIPEINLWCSPKARHPQTMTFPGLLSGCSKQTCSMSCVVADRYSECSKTDTYYDHGPSKLLFPAVIYKHCLLRRLLLYFPMLGNLFLQICTYRVYGVFEKISTTRNDLRCFVFRPRERELYYMRACSVTVLLPLLTGYDDNATHSCCSRHDHWYTITDQNERQ